MKSHNGIFTKAEGLNPQRGFAGGPPSATARQFSSEGTKHDQGKLRYDLIPPDVMDEVAFVLTHGAKKYGDRNWELGIEFSRTLAAAERHIAAFKAREQLDAEGGTHHLANAIVELMFTLAFDLRGTGGDDRGEQVKLPRRQSASGTLIEYEPGGPDDPTAKNWD